MKFLKAPLSILFALVLTPTVSLAAPPPAIRESVAVCDPNSPKHCQAPNADGSVFVHGPVLPLGYQQITTLSSATALTLPAGATVAVIICETQAVRWRDDGTNPTATVGEPLATGQPMTYTGSTGLTALRFIEQTASAKLNITYY